MTTEQKLRERFESLISSGPYEKDIRRWPDDATRHAWPGSYRDINVDLAWHVVRALTATEGAEPETRALEQDAKRYRWLREKNDHGGDALAVCEPYSDKGTFVWSPISGYLDEFCDRAIDAAMEQEKR